MNDKFYELSEEKQMLIINAGLQVFSQNEYKRASTDEIARLAKTSKGLLFYYFHNKKELYLFLYQYAKEIVTQSVVNSEYEKITDFYELCEYAGKQKFQLLSKTPYIMDFMVRAVYSQKEDVSEDMNKNLENITVGIFNTYFNSIDFSKFKSNVNPVEILQMLTWMTDGYLHEKQRISSGNSLTIDIAILMEKYHQWIQMLKQITYKEEYLV